MKVRLPVRATGCLSDLALDELLAQQGTHAHLGECPACEARLHALERAREAFAAEPAPLYLARARRKVRWLEPSGLAAIAAAILLFVVTRPGEDATRLKGSAHLGFYVKHGEAVRAGVNGEHVRPGDVLRFTYTAPEESQLVILSLDGAHHASVYYTGRAAAASDHPLEQGTVLDATLGSETVYGIFCAQSIAVESLRASLEASGTLAVPSTCRVDELVIHKE